MTKVCRKITKRKNRDTSKTNYSLNVIDYNEKGDIDYQIKIDGDKHGIYYVNSATYENNKRVIEKCYNLRSKIQQSSENIIIRNFFYDGVYPTCLVENGKVSYITVYNDDKSESVMYKVEGSELVKRITKKYTGEIDENNEPIISDMFIVCEDGIERKFVEKSDCDKKRSDIKVEEIKNNDGLLIRQIIDDPNKNYIIEEEYLHDSEIRCPKGPEQTPIQELLRLGEVYIDRYL